MTDGSAREWLTAVRTELGLEGATDSQQGLEAVAELGRRVGLRVDDGAVADTAFLVGVAAGRAEEPAVAARDIARKLGAMAEGWPVDAERGVPADDRSRRG